MCAINTGSFAVQENAAVAAAACLEWIMKAALQKAIDLLSHEDIADSMRHRAKPDLLPGGYILLALLENAQWCALLDRNGEESLCDLVGHFIDSSTLALAQKRAADVIPAGSTAISARQRIVGRVPSKSGLHSGGSSAASSAAASRAPSPAPRDEAALGAAHDRTANRWARRADDAVGDVEAAALLRCVHPGYTLTNDAVLLLGALSRELMASIARAFVQGVKAGAPDADVSHGAVSGKDALTALMAWLPAEWTGGALGAARLAMRAAAGQCHVPAELSLRVKRLRGLRVQRTLRLKAPAGDPLRLSLWGPACKALRVKPDDVVFLWKGAQLSNAATPAALGMGLRPLQGGGVRPAAPPSPASPSDGPSDSDAAEAVAGAAGTGAARAASRAKSSAAGSDSDSAWSDSEDEESKKGGSESKVEGGLVKSPSATAAPPDRVPSPAMGPPPDAPSLPLGGAVSPTGRAVDVWVVDADVWAHARREEARRGMLTASRATGPTGAASSGGSAAAVAAARALRPGASPQGAKLRKLGGHTPARSTSPLKQATSPPASSPEPVLPTAGQEGGARSPPPTAATEISPPHSQVRSRYSSGSRIPAPTFAAKLAWGDAGENGNQGEGGARGSSPRSHMRLLPTPQEGATRGGAALRAGRTTSAPQDDAAGLLDDRRLATLPDHTPGGANNTSPRRKFLKTPNHLPLHKFGLPDGGARGARAPPSLRGMRGAGAPDSVRKDVAAMRAGQTPEQPSLQGVHGSGRTKLQPIPPGGSAHTPVVADSMPGRSRRDPSPYGQAALASRRASMRQRVAQRKAELQQQGGVEGGVEGGEGAEESKQSAASSASSTPSRSPARRRRAPKRSDSNSRGASPARPSTGIRMARAFAKVGSETEPALASALAKLTAYQQVASRLRDGAMPDGELSELVPSLPAPRSKSVAGGGKFDPSRGGGHHDVKALVLQASDLETALSELQGAATSALRVVATLQRVGLSSLQRAHSKMASPLAKRSPPRRRKPRAGGVRGSPLRGRSKAPSNAASPRPSSDRTAASPRAALAGTAPTPEKINAALAAAARAAVSASLAAAGKQDSALSAAPGPAPSLPVAAAASARSAGSGGEGGSARQEGGATAGLEVMRSSPRAGTDDGTFMTAPQ